MKLLIVDDDEAILDLLQHTLGGVAGLAITVARSRRSAQDAIAGSSYDFIILDLHLPTEDRAADPSEIHGFAVRSDIESTARGTPVLFFTGHESTTVYRKIYPLTEQRDCWGVGQKEQMLTLLSKDDLAECIARVKRCAEQCDKLSQIDISSGVAQLALTDDQKRVIRIFARMHKGQNVVVAKLGGGLSGALTCRIEVQGEHGATVCYAVAKLGKIEDLKQEYAAFESFVSPVIVPGGFAHVIKFIEAGAAGTGGIFYGLAAEHDWTLFDALRAKADNAPQIVERLTAIEQNWQDAATIRNCTVADVRRELIHDDAFNKVIGELPFNVAQLESAQIRIKYCKQHRDLHGLNVLLRNRAEPLLIDFGESGDGPACLDPTILELSLLFHPTCKTACEPWPETDVAKKWDNLDEFIAASPLRDFIRACRTWACQVEPNDRARYAVAYAFAVRQLKYPETNKALATAVAHAAAIKVIG